MNGEEKAEKWLVDNNWDYKKYRDKRPDRSAYDGLMNYEITDELRECYLAAHAEGRRDGIRECVEWLRSEEARLILTFPKDIPAGGTMTQNGISWGNLLAEKLLKED